MAAACADLTGMEGANVLHRVSLPAQLNYRGF
jgi:hypothetical protein